MSLGLTVRNIILRTTTSIFFWGFLLGTYRVMSNISTSPPPMYYGFLVTNGLHLATTYVLFVFRDKLFWKEEKKKRRERQGKKMSHSKPMISRKACETQRRTQSTSRLDRVWMVKYKEMGEKGGVA